MKIITDRAITLTEPWATLMAIGAKKNETRSRAMGYRGWLAIHAAKRFPPGCVLTTTQEPFVSTLRDVIGDVIIGNTLGKVIAVVHVIKCEPTSEGCFIPRSLDFVPEPERSFGDYSLGRYYYITDQVRRLKVPFPARGFQSLPWRLKTPITEDMLCSP